MDVGDEASCFFQAHAGPLGIAFKIEHQQGLIVRTNDIQEMLRLIHTVAVRSEMIGAPEHTRVHGSALVRPVSGIDVLHALCRLVDDSKNVSGVLHLLEIEVLVVVRLINDAINLRHGPSLSPRSPYTHDPGPAELANTRGYVTEPVAFLGRKYRVSIVTPIGPAFHP